MIVDAIGNAKFVVSYALARVRIAHRLSSTIEARDGFAAMLASDSHAYSRAGSRVLACVQHLKAGSLATPAEAAS